MKKKNGTEDLRGYRRDGSKGIKNKRMERGEAKHILKCSKRVWPNPGVGFATNTWTLAVYHFPANIMDQYFQYLFQLLFILFAS